MTEPGAESGAVHTAAAEREPTASDAPADLTRVQRRRSELKAAMADVDAALKRATGADPAAWLADIRSQVEELRRAFDHHVEVHEGPDSFHAEILKTRPHLSSQIARLQRDHVRLRASLDHLAESLESVGEDAAEQARRLGQDVLHQFTVHRRRGADLVWEAFNYDLGGEH